MQIRLQETTEIKGIAQHFGKYVYLLLGRELDEKDYSCLSVAACKLNLRDFYLMSWKWTFPCWFGPCFSFHFHLLCELDFGTSQEEVLNQAPGARGAVAGNWSNNVSSHLNSDHNSIHITSLCGKRHLLTKIMNGKEWLKRMGGAIWIFRPSSPSGEMRPSR